MAKGWPVPAIYTDEDFSGTKDVRERRELAHLLANVADAIDAVIMLALDRLGRKTRIVLDMVDSPTRRGVTLVSCTEQLDTSTPHGRFTLTMFAVLA